MGAQRKKYDSYIPWLYKINRSDILEPVFRKTIPRSTIQSWKSEACTSYYGSEYRAFCETGLDRELILSEYKNLRRTVNGLMRIWLGASAVFIPLVRQQKELKSWWIDQTQQLMRFLPRKTVFRLTGFNTNSFSYHLKTLFPCILSPIGQCLKQNMKQLRSEEVSAIRVIFTDENKAHWPMVSLYYHGLKTGAFRMGLSTFYKYARLLNLSRKFRKPISRSKGIQATHVNQFLHVDTTFWKLPDTGLKAAITFASDNFSRFITGFSVAERNCSTNVAAVLMQTIENIKRFHPDYQTQTDLIADGGSENHAHIITDLLNASKPPPIRKLIALKDIAFSNSPIEAINKIFKRFLRHVQPKSYEDLIRLVEIFVHEYNTLRPHGSLNGLTPLEAYQCQATPDFKSVISAAQATRIAQNQQRKCENAC